jgi:hypothetical protein
MTVRMLGILLLSASPSVAQDARSTSAAAAQPCVGDNGGITLPPGFCATVFADNIGHSEGDNWAPPMGGIGAPYFCGRYADINSVGDGSETAVAPNPVAAGEIGPQRRALAV